MGRSKKVPQSVKDEILRIKEEKPIATAEQIKKELSNRGINISISTIRKCLREGKASSKSDRPDREVEKLIEGIIMLRYSKSADTDQLLEIAKHYGIYTQMQERLKELKLEEYKRTDDKRVPTEDLLAELKNTIEEPEL